MNINGQEFTIGADPEIFMGKDGKFVSAHDKIPGDKYNPFFVEKGAVQVDGMALEFNINPATTFAEFEGNLDTVQKILKDMIGDYDFLTDSSVTFDEDFLKNIPNRNVQLGCSADYNGWTLEEFPSPNAAKNMRTAGGHIHIGGFKSDEPYHPDHFNVAARLARMLDETLGVYSILWDKDDQRREMYGKAGSFRPKHYGMEYRTLSNKWIFNKKIMKFVYDGAMEAIEKVFTSSYEPDATIANIINTSDRQSSFFVGNQKAQQLMV